MTKARQGWEIAVLEDRNGATARGVEEEVMGHF